MAKLPAVLQGSRAAKKFGPRDDLHCCGCWRTFPSRLYAPYPPELSLVTWSPCDLREYESDDDGPPSSSARFACSEDCERKIVADQIKAEIRMVSTAADCELYGDQFFPYDIGGPISEIRFSRSPVIGRGIYLLMLEETVVYIGQSRVSALQRSGQHIKDKDFDAVLYVDGASLADRQLTQLEYLLIDVFDPEHNILGRRAA